MLRPRLMAGAGVLGALGVLAGAFGAHALGDILSPERLVAFETGTRYHLVHAALVAVIALAAPAGRLYTVSAMAFATGVVVFSGSLYLLVLLDAPMLGAVTPIGGIAFLVGWGALAIAGWRQRGGEGGRGAHDHREI
jgi:uncharacterized membrane protein YgdD (TMEM256/DUF423 family)